MGTLKVYCAFIALNNFNLEIQTVLIFYEAEYCKPVFSNAALIAQHNVDYH